MACLDLMSLDIHMFSIENNWLFLASYQEWKP